MSLSFNDLSTPIVPKQEVYVLRRTRRRPMGEVNSPSTSTTHHKNDHFYTPFSSSSLAMTTSRSPTAHAAPHPTTNTMAATTNGQPPPPQQPFTSTMDVLKERVDDLFNIFYKYSQCDPTIGTSKSMNGYYWREKDFSTFLREFQFLSLFGRRACLELYHGHSSKHSATNQSRLSFDEFLWCMSSFANALPWSAGHTSMERTTLLLHSLDVGLRKMSHARGPHRIASPRHKWLSKYKTSKPSKAPSRLSKESR